MKSFAAQGWASVKDQFYVVILLFLYRLLWGYALFRVVKAVVMPMLLRYPDPAPSELSKLLYFFEGEMALAQGHYIYPFAWVLAGMLLLRMILTPLIYAGIFHNLHQEAAGERGLFLFQGMRRFWKPAALFYAAKLVLTLVPVFWVIPSILPSVLDAVREPKSLFGALPYLAGWIIYSGLVHLVLLHMQFAVTGGRSLLKTIGLLLRRFGVVISLSLAINGGSLLVLLMLSGLSLWWAGLVGLIIQQAAYFAGCLFQLWGVASQYHALNLNHRDR